MSKSEARLVVIIEGLEYLIRHGGKDADNKTPISCENIIEELYELRRLLREDLHC